uniref:Leucine zipper transcription factor-like protein 1 n=1 Tax=Spironucleus salmonicida TaxID=348837 RepID=V6LEJ3_9EUKA|eukprot:EST42935.1 hypothetical protein SS50377_17468 [Spironucleus salmonicida]
MQKPVQDVVRFFSLFFKQSLSEIQSISQDQLQELNFSGKSVFDVEEVREVLTSFASQINSLVSSDQEKISKLAGSLAMQLMSQASEQSVEIQPKITDLENEARLKMFEKGVDNQNATQFKKVDSTSLIQNEGRIKELEAQLLQKDAELAEAGQLLQAKVDAAPQYQNIVRMMKKKNEEIEELRDRLGE